MTTASALAFDRASVRVIDRDGHLHVETANISKAAVNPYLGLEIVGAEKIGLDPDRVYKLLRDPEELAKAAPSISGKPILLIHRPVNADNHPRQITVGSVGTEPEFVAPFLRAALTIWDAEALALIESDRQKELSAGYHYEPDMTPGTYEGEDYDGVMRNLAFNHVALVEKGRAGAECFIGDSLGEIEMAQKPLSRKAALLQGAALAFLHPKLAQDSRINLAPIFAGITAKNFGEKKKDVAEALVKAASGKLAADASLDLEAAEKLLDALQDINPAEDDAEPANPVPGKTDEALDGEGLSDEEEAQYQALLKRRKPVAEDEGETDEEKAAREAREKADKEKDKDMVTKPAMDAAIAAASKMAHDAAVKTQREIREAEKFVAPWVGELIAQDSAVGVLQTAALALKIPDAGKITDPVALRALISISPKPGENARPASTIIAQDSAADAEYLKNFPDAKRLKK